MDSTSLFYALDLVSGAGLTLSSEQKAALKTSLIILQKNYKFQRVLFWGKILGITGDYFIAQGVTDDEMRDKKTLYSLNCMDWNLLPPPTDEMTAYVNIAAIGRFIGDPSHEYEYTETRRFGEGDEAQEEDIMIKVTEEKRLATTVARIDQEVSVVPRGAYIKNPHGTVQKNRSFEGLSFGEAGKLSNYLHFSEPKQPRKLSILVTAESDPCKDFLDRLSEDLPKGSWSIQFERGSSVCVLRSLLWLGLSFFHIPETPQHGYIYMGPGLKNLDLPFML
ncbi:radial spoke head protein 9 homolog [Clupea harengus]|uniref:Radial spoke head protein 9 homolog n=1 Tax=Clupea harengus TaxID=7950 RepID=A0A6P8GFK0_CLUHA|nr:radial spoke head protein 9 homolog [Clupea harengus]